MINHQFIRDTLCCFPCFRALAVHQHNLQSSKSRFIIAKLNHQLEIVEQLLESQHWTVKRFHNL